MRFTEQAEKMINEILIENRCDALTLISGEVEGGIAIEMGTIRTEPGERVITVDNVRVAVTAELEEMLETILFEVQGNTLVMTETRTDKGCGCGCGSHDGEHQCGCGCHDGDSEHDCCCGNHDEEKDHECCGGGEHKCQGGTDGGHKCNGERKLDGHGQGNGKRDCKCGNHKN